MNELEKLIADSIDKRNAKNAAAVAERIAEEAKYEALFKEAVADTIDGLKPAIPGALRQYVNFKGGPPSNRYFLDTRKWAPSHLDINAPGLAEITLHICENDDGETVIHSMGVEGATSLFHDGEWPEAIAAAFDRYHERRAEYSKAARELG
jgi:hypothetical protein